MTDGEPAELAVARTRAARALGLEDRFDEGHALLDTIDPGGDPEGRARIALERGRLWRSSGRPDDARVCFDHAVAVAQVNRLDVVHVDALHMVALVAPADEQIAIIDAALDIARASDDQEARDWDASLLNNRGMTHADAGDFDAALLDFEQALAAARRIGVVENVRIARWMVAWAWRNLGRRDDALREQLALRDELAAAGEQDPYVDEEIALLEG